MSAKTLRQLEHGKEDLVAQLRDAPASFLAGLMARPGEDFLDSTMAYLRESTNVDIAFIGELQGEDWQTVHVLAGSQANGTSVCFDYNLLNTPCADVLRRDLCFLETGVVDAYPEDHMLADMSVDSYVGLALRDEYGDAIGILVLLSKSPLTDTEIRDIGAKMRLFAPRLEGELHYRTAVHSMELAASDAVTSQSTLESLVEVLATATGIKSIFVSVIDSEDSNIAHTIVHYVDGLLVPNESYSMEGPCAKTHEGRQDVLILSGLQQEYPECEHIHTMKAQAYAGRPFLDPQGEILGYLGFLHDKPIKASILSRSLNRLLIGRLASEMRRRQAEQESKTLQRRLLAARRHESIGSLASGIAHDFNNLLFVVGAQASLLRVQLAGLAGVTEQVDAIIDAASKAGRLCEQLLTYAGRRDSEITTLDMNRVIEDSLLLAKMFATEKASLQHRLHKGPIYVHGGETHLQQVVMNLVKNAADAITGHGMIHIETSISERSGFPGAVVGSHLPAGNYATLIVSDNGCGMTKEQMRSVFAPYFTTKTTGHGMGLAVVVASTESHGGALEISSEPELGTTFTMSIPLIREGLVKSGTDGVPGSETEPEKGAILIIDDESLVGNTVKAILASAGRVSHVAGGGPEGIAMFAELHNDLAGVVLDYAMPGMSGDEVLIELRQISRNVPVLLMSGNISQSMADSFHEPPDAFLSKPFASELLISTLAELSPSQLQ